MNQVRRAGCWNDRREHNLPVSQRLSRPHLAAARRRFSWRVAARAIALLAVLGFAAPGAWVSSAWADGGDGAGSYGSDYSDGGQGGTFDDPQGVSGTGNGGGGGGGPGGGLGGQGSGDGGDGGQGGEHAYVGDASSFPTSDLTGEDGERGGDTMSEWGGAGGGGAGGYGALITSSGGSITVHSAQTVQGGRGGGGGDNPHPNLPDGDSGDAGVGIWLRGGGLTNWGLVAGGEHGGAGVVLDGGDLVNESGATIRGLGSYGDGVQLVGGDLTNRGLIAGNWGGNGVVHDGGDLRNESSGTITSSFGLLGYTPSGNGVTFDGGGNLINLGSIDAGSSSGNVNYFGFDGVFYAISGTGVSFSGGGDLLNKSGGTIAGSTGIEISGSAGGAGVSFSGGGTLTNEVDATITGGNGADASAIYDLAGGGGTGVVIDDGNLINHGQIIAGQGADRLGPTDHTYGGFGGGGVALTNGDLENTGSITSGNGGDGFLPAAAVMAVSLTDGDLINSGSIAGGNGGTGNVLAGNGGGGVLLTGGDLTNSGSITGGNTGDGVGNIDLLTGFAGFGVSLSKGKLTNTGSIIGGDAGDYNFELPALDYVFASVGGAGVTGSDLNVINSGVITAGFDSNDGPRTAAIAFTGGINRLELRVGSTINGIVDATAAGNDTLALGGSQNSSFDLGQLGPAGQYQGFEHFEKTGDGDWSLTGIAATGSWRVEQGRLAVDGELATSVFVQSPATLGGVGTILDTVTSQGTIAPGNSIGKLTLATTVFMAGSTLEIEMGDALGAAGVGYDWLAVEGDLFNQASSTNPLTIALTTLDSLNAPGEALNFDPALSYSWTVATAGDAIYGLDSAYQLETGGFLNDLRGGSFSLAMSGNSLQLLFSPAAVPEPASILIAAVGAVALFATRHRRQR